MEKQQVGDVSFPGLAPNTVHRLIPMGSMVKTDTKVDGPSMHHWTGDLAAAGFCSKEGLAGIGKVSLHLHRLSGTAHSMGLVFFILYVCLCLGQNLFILQVVAHPIRSPTCRELSVPSCLMGIWLGVGGEGRGSASFSAPGAILQVLQGGCSSTVGDEKLQDHWWLFFFFFGGLHHCFVMQQLYTFVLARFSHPV